MSRAARIFFGIVGLLLIVRGFRFLFSISPGDSWGAAVPALFGFACMIAGAVCLAPGLIGVVTRPLTSFFGGFFYPEQHITAPPEPLIRALRLRILDRHFESATQQIDALLDAYGPRPELYHLRAHLVAAQGGEVQPVTAEATRALPLPALDTYLALLRRDPPPPPRPPEETDDASS